MLMDGVLSNVKQTQPCQSGKHHVRFRTEGGRETDGASQIMDRHVALTWTRQRHVETPRAKDAMINRRR